LEHEHPPHEPALDLERDQPLSRRHGLLKDLWNRLRELTASREPADDSLIAGIVDELNEEALLAVIESTITGQKIDPIAARLIGYTTLTYTDSLSPHGYLLRDRFFERGEGSHEQLREAYLPVHDALEADSVLPLLADYLGTYLIDREHPRSNSRPIFDMVPNARFPRHPDRPGNAITYATSGSLSPRRRNWLEEGLEIAIMQTGEPLRAYLRLPGTDATDLRLMEHFDRRYRGTVQHSADLAPHNRVLATDWEAVELAGQIHVFVP
jgi:hypothetical protein